MAVKFSLDTNGIEQLREKIAKRYEEIALTLATALKQVGEEAVTYSKDNKEYRDHTSNLKNSISYVLYFDGQPVYEYIGVIPDPSATPKGQAVVKESIDTYAERIGVSSMKGFTLILVAGMEYGKYVEDKGYNVLHLTERFLQKEILSALEEMKDW